MARVCQFDSRRHRAECINITMGEVGLVGTLVSVEIGQVVERYHNFVMVAAECFFEGRQPSFDGAARREP